LILVLYGKISMASLSQMESVSLNAKDLRNVNVKELAPKLKFLSIEGKLDDVDEKQLLELLAEAKNLWSLGIVCSNLKKYPLEMGRLTNLGYLNLFKNELTSLPSEIGELSKLRSLGLGHNKLKSLPPEIGKLVCLKELSLSKNSLNTLPAEIGDLTNLECLHLEFNCLKTLPPEIGKLTNLIKLDLTKNCFTMLPSEIGQLLNLKVLILNQCTSLTFLPPEIGNLINLNELYFKYVETIKLPGELWSLPSLNHVELEEELSIRRFVNFNDYFDVEDEIEYDDEYEMISDVVKKLNLNDKHLTRLPLDIIMCKSLKELHISNNQLIEVPAILSKLEELVKIDVSKNPKIDLIDKIPDPVLGIPALEKIILSEKDQVREFQKDEIEKIKEERKQKIAFNSK